MLNEHNVLKKQHDALTNIYLLNDVLLEEESDSFAEEESGANIRQTRRGFMGLVECVEGIWIILRTFVSELAEGT